MYRAAVAMAMSKEIITLETSSDSEKESLCVPCLDDGEHRQAIKYCIDCAHLVCQNCVMYHRRFKQMKEHKLVDISTTEDLKLSQKLSNLLICPNHPEKTVELVCKSHDVFCCLTCATVSHRDCREVMEVTKEALDKKQTPAADELKSHLTAAKDHITSIVKQHEHSQSDFVASADELIPKKLHELKQKLTQAFAVMEQTILIERNKQKVSHKSKHDVQKAKWVKHIQSIDEAISLLSSVQQNGSPVHMYVVANKLQKTINDADAAIANQGNKLTTETISLKVGVDLQKVVSSQPSRMAELCVTDATTSLLEYKFATDIDMDSKTGGKCRACRQRVRFNRADIFGRIICPNCGTIQR